MGRRAMFSTDIKPYNETWLDCRKNLLVSILQSVNKIYNKVALINDYEYICEEHLSDCKVKFNSIAIKSGFSVMGEFFTNYSTLKYDDEEMLINIVKEQLEKNKFILIDVDMYYWNPANYCYGKLHWNHKTLITRYDPEETCFWVLDVGGDNYFGEYKINLHEFYLAIDKMNNGIIEVCDLNDKVIIPNYTINNLKDNIYRQINSIEMVCNKYYWKMLDEDFKLNSYCDYIYITLKDIEFRHQANHILLSDINKIMRLDGFEEILALCKEIKKNWSIVKSLAYRLYYQDKLSERIKKVNNILYRTLVMEKEMWEAVIQGLETINYNVDIYNFSPNTVML